VMLGDEKTKKSPNPLIPAKNPSLKPTCWPKQAFLQVEPLILLITVNLLV